jgi:putative salt-induced outer membrane protein YdiY
LLHRYFGIITLIIFILYTPYIFALDESASASQDTTTKKKNPNPWQVKAGLGVNITGGNSDTRTFSFDSDASKLFRMFRYRGVVRTQHGTSRYSGGPRIETTNNWLVNSRFDFFTSEKRDMFLFTFVSLDGNKFRGYRSKRTVQAGFGFKLFSSIESVDMNIALGLDYSKDELVVPGSRRDEIFSGVLKPELDWAITKDILFGQRTSFFVDLQDEEQYQIDVNTFLNLKLSGKLTLRTSYLLNYRNRPRLINELDQSGRPTGQRIPAKFTDRVFMTSILLNF